MVAAIARLRCHSYNVADFITNDRLHVISEIRKQHFTHGLTVGHWSIVFVDNFQNRPIGIYMHPARGGATICQE